MSLRIRYRCRVNWSRALSTAMASSKTLKNQTALARKSGVSQSAISRIIRGEVDHRVGMLDKIAGTYGLTLVKLIEMGQPVDQKTQSGVRS